MSFELAGLEMKTVEHSLILVKTSRLLTSKKRRKPSHKLLGLYHLYGDTREDTIYCPTLCKAIFNEFAIQLILPTLYIDLQAGKLRTHEPNHSEIAYTCSKLKDFTEHRQRKMALE